MPSLQSGSQSEHRPLRGSRVLVMGLGRFGGGVGVTRWLVEQGALVTVTDQAPADTLRDSIEAVRDCGVALHLGGHLLTDLEATDLVIVNPAVVKAQSQYFREIERRKLAWTTEMNLFCERCPAAVIGVTGSFGKSTTCAMLAEALRACFSKAGNPTPVHLGGNIGHSLLPELARIRTADVVVLEMSNAQLEDLPRIDWAPDFAVITNLFPHHLDRYSSFRDYVAAKLNIILPGRTRVAIVGELHAEAEYLFHQRMADTHRSARPTIPRTPEHRKETHEVRVRPSPSDDLDLRIPGQHNQINAACVLEVCRQWGLEGFMPAERRNSARAEARGSQGFPFESTIRTALARFTGLPHRLQFVRSIHGVDYYNDSKSTSPSATIQAVHSFQRPMMAIVGGQRKGISWTQAAETLVNRCHSVICMGESGTEVADALRRAVALGNQVNRPVETQIVEGLESAVGIARQLAKPGDIVLFSPGAPSFDQYANFTQRGDHFIQILSKSP